VKTFFISMLSILLVYTGAANAAKKTAAKEPEIKIPIIKMDGADGKDIVEVAVGSKDHTSLVAAVKAAGLVEVLTGPGPYTVFAPTDAAFGKVPKATIDKLFKPESKADLKALLEHHTAAPAYRVEVLTGLTDLDMVDGPKLKVTKKDGKLFVDDIEIKAAITAKNGVVYIVDTVLIPK
jgi:uncharacterized surface protein with fasciclin (FAS1) repeats